jgi:hypothetical protein
MNIPSIKCRVLQAGLLALMRFEIEKVVTNDRAISDPIMEWRGYLNTWP